MSITINKDDLGNEEEGSTYSVYKSKKDKKKKKKHKKHKKSKKRDEDPDADVKDDANIMSVIKD